MAKVILRSLLLLLVVTLLMPAMVNSQNNAHSQYRDLIGSDFHQSYLNSAATPTVISHPSFGVFQIQPIPVDGDRYSYSYMPNVSEGNSSAVVEFYKIDPETGELVPDYTTIYFRVTESIITCGDDRRKTAINKAVTGINILENDTRSNGPLELTSIVYSENGMALIENDMISFVPEQDFVGDAFVYYQVEDALGKSGVGVLKIKVVDYNTVKLADEIDIVSYGGESVELDLPIDGLELTSDLSYGVLETSDGSTKYIPHSNTSGSESFTLESGTVIRKVNVLLVEKAQSNSWVVDDVRYTSKGTPVTLNVVQNDYKKNSTITNSSPELVQEEDVTGLFTYTPSRYFTGRKEMSYTVFNGFESETGKVTIHVNNFNPSTRIDYEFTTVANSALVVDYNIPISNYSFTVLQEPEHGNVVVNSGTSSIDVGCEQIYGTNLIIYEPSYNFQGSDEFRVRYCVDGKCKNITIEVNVIANELTECGCYTGCVWPGDANNDGVVNAADLIVMAYQVGATGSETEWNGASGWIGRNTVDWQETDKNGVNAKFSDADGNGLVDEFDFDAILENYSENHALVPPQILDNKAYPFSIKPVEDTVYAGDYLSFEIGVGNDDYPALDVNGLVYTLGFPPHLVDSASVDLDYHSDSWLGVDEKVYGMYKQIRDGWLETSVTRLGVNAKSGRGKIGTLNFIVEEDVVGGFRVADDGIIPIQVTIQDAQVMLGDGQMATLPDAEATIYLNLKKRSAEDRSANLLVYPNPASDQVTVHMNGGHDILSYQVYNIAGQLVQHASTVDDRSDQIELASYHEGIYIVKAITTSGVRTAKFEVY